MNEKQAKLGRFGVSLFLAATVALGLSGQQSNHTRTPLVTDWSSRHLIFSTPTTRENLIAAMQEPRYQQQWLRRNLHPAPPKDGDGTLGALEMRGAAEADDAASTFEGSSIVRDPAGKYHGPHVNTTIHRDWSTSLGPNATIGAGTYPAKFAFDTSTASCANDFVAMGTNVVGAAAGASATATGTFSGSGPNDGETATLTYGSGSVATVTATAAATASASGAFTGNSNAGQTATIAGTLTLTAVPGGTVTFAGGSPNNGDTVVIGATTYTLSTTCAAGPACVVRSAIVATDAANLVKAINNTCLVAHTDCNVTSGANTSVTATSALGVVTLTNKVGAPAAYTLSESATNTTVDVGARGSGSNTGTNFVIGVTNATAVASNNATSLAADIAANGGGVGVTASSNNGTVTVTATTAGTGGNGKTLAETLGNFTWTNASTAGGAAPQSGNNFFAITNATGTALSLTTITSNFATAVGNETTTAGVPVTVSPSGAVATVTASAVAPGSLGNGVALTDGLSNFVWNHTTLQGGVGQASIVAYKNLYSSCGGTVPTAFWSYFTNGIVQTSPALSLDGKQLAFVQSSAGGVASLVLLKWASAAVTAGSPVTLTTQTASAYSACTAPCMLTLQFNGAHNDTNSSPFYDYTNDILYVGDDNGVLHKFTPIFNGGTPAEITTSPWPVSLTNSAGMVTTSPVLSISDNAIFIGTARTSNGGTTGGYFYRVNPTSGAVIASDEIASVPGIADAPLVDAFAGRVYVSVSSDTTGDCLFGFNCSAVFQFGTAFAAASPGVEQELGTGSGTRPMFAGDFDNTYFNSSDPPTGSLYVCGQTGGNARLFRLPIAANVMGGAVNGPTLTNGGFFSSTTCSPITEAFNGTTDLIFVSVQDNGDLGTCTGNGCVMAFNVTSGTLSTGASPTASLPENGGASGMIIDTLGSATVGANQVYLTPLATGQTCPSGAGCAIQASQSGLN